jgi:hypothetical protein
MKCCGCYTNKTKNCCAKVVLVLALPVFAVGVLSIIFGAIQIGSVPPEVMANNEVLQQFDLDIN